jgi:glycosyltransferase involved in cell wall biosynthesis
MDPTVSNHSGRRKKHQRSRVATRRSAVSSPDAAQRIYANASVLAAQGEYRQARRVYEALASRQLAPSLYALIENDLGALDALVGEIARARNHFERALSLDPNCQVARQNLDSIADPEIDPPPVRALAACEIPRAKALSNDKVRVAIVSMLFNWPSTGGGTVHTAEAGKFLTRAGYDVRHFYAQFAHWGVGNVAQPLDYPAEALPFEPAEWTAAEIQRRFREAIDKFSPDYVILTDSWNFKPLLAEAVRGYRYFLRLAAQECLCPLNNVRLLVDDQGHSSACPRNQLATADACRTCVSQRQHQSGSLHQLERALSGYGSAEYDEKLRRAFAEAEGVLAVNPLIAAAASPYSKAVHVVPSGFDPDRFPWPWPNEAASSPRLKKQIFFAGLVGEYMKGFRVLQAACAKLWEKRQDFEIVATSDPPGQIDPMIRFIGWQPQADLPKRLREADFLVFPTIAEEALGRSAVEAMGVGRPVLASRIGGLPFTVIDGLTGLLFAPGNAFDLAEKIEVLIDDPALRTRMGSAGRQRFEEHFTWDVVIDKHYRRLLAPVCR